MVEVAEQGGREARGVEQIGYHHTHVAGRGNVAHQAHRAWAERTAVVGAVAPVGRGQRDDSLGQAAAQKRSHAGEAGVAGTLNAHAEIDAAPSQ